MNFNSLGSWLVISSLMGVPFRVQNTRELSNNFTEMKTWYCTNENQTTLVEVKLLDNWQEIMNIQKWQCGEPLGGIPHNPKGFFCKISESNINVVRVTWWKGDNAKTLMKNWMTAFQEQNMICIYENQEFWNEDNYL